MKKFYLNLALIFSSPAVAVGMTEANSWLQELKDELSIKSDGHVSSEEIRPNWRELLDNIVITKAEKHGQIVRHFPSSFIDDFEEPICSGIEIQPKAFTADNNQLFNYLLINKIPIINEYEHLMKLAIKKNSIKILHTFHKHKLFDNNRGEEWLLQAIKRNRLQVVKFFLDVLKLSIDKADHKFLLAAGEQAMIHLLKAKEFLGEGQLDEKRISKVRARSRINSIRSDLPSTIEGGPEVYTISEVFDLIGTGDIIKLQEILKLRQIENLNQVNEWGETVVTCAVKANSNPRIINLLAQFGADLELANNEEYTPLMLAVQSGNTLLVRTLLDLDVNRDIPCQDKTEDISITPLMCAIKNQHNDIAWLLARDKKTDLNFQDVHQQDALIYALIAKNDELAEFLLNQVIFANKSCALIWATQLEHEEIVSKLLDLRADPNFSKDSYTALDYAVKRGNYEITRLLLQSTLVEEENKSQALKTAILETPCDPEILIKIIKLLLENGADPDTLGNKEEGRTLLMHAARKNYEPVVKLLLQFGANIQLVDKNGYTALMHASKKGNGKVVFHILDNIQESRFRRLLVLPKEGTDAVDAEGNSALLHACFVYDPVTVSRLLTWGCDTRTVNHNQDTALLVLAKLNERQLCYHIAKICKQYIAQYAYFQIPQPESIKGKEKEILLDSSLIELPDILSDSNNTADLDIRAIKASTIILKEIEKINTSDSHPLKQLSSLLEAKTRGQGPKATAYRTALEFLGELTNNEIEMIYQCCKAVLKWDPKIIKCLDRQQQSAITHAINNNNVGAVRALVPYLSQKEYKAAMALAIRQKRRLIQETLLLKEDKCHIS